MRPLSKCGKLDTRTETSAGTRNRLLSQQPVVINFLRHLLWTGNAHARASHRSAARLVFTCVPLGCLLGQPSRHVCMSGHVRTSTRELLGSALKTTGLRRWPGALRRRWGLRLAAHARRRPEPGAPRASPRGRPRPAAAQAPLGRGTRRPGTHAGVRSEPRPRRSGREGGPTARSRPRCLRAPSWFWQNFENRRTPVT